MHSDYDNLNIPLSKLRLRSTERISADTGKNGVYTLNRSLFLHRANAEQHIEFSQPSSFFISLLIPVCVQNIQGYSVKTSNKRILWLKYSILLVYLGVHIHTVGYDKGWQRFHRLHAEICAKLLLWFNVFSNKWMCFIIFSPLLFFIL